MRPTVSLIPLALLLSVAPLRAQSARPSVRVRVTSVSDLRPDFSDGGGVSPNGRYYILSSYAFNDSGFQRYDRAKKTWTFLGRDAAGTGARWSPDGRFVSFSRLTEDARSRQVWLLPMDTSTGLAAGPPRRVSNRPVSGAPSAWAPDGRSIALVGRDSTGLSIVAVPFNGGDERILFHAPGEGVSVVWSPDGKYVFADHARPKEPAHTLRISVADKHVDDLGETRGFIIDISPDGRWLAEYVWWRAALFLRSTDGKQVREIPMGISSQQTVPTGWSRTNPNEFNGLQHVVPTSVQQISIGDGRIRSLTPIDSLGMDAPTLSPDGKRIAFGRRTATTWQLVLADTNGANARVVAETDAPVQADWSPTGQHILYGNLGQGVYVLEVAGLRSHVVLPANPCQGFSRDCQVIRTWRTDGKAIRYFVRHQTKDGRVIDLREVTLDGNDKLLMTSRLAGAPEFIARTDTLFLVADQSALHLVNVRTGADRVLYAAGGTRATAVADLSADGKWIATVADNYDVEPVNPTEVPLLISLATGEAKRFPYSLGGEVSKVFFHPDGRNFMLIACPTCHGGARYVEKWEMILVPMNGDPPRVLTAAEPDFKDFWATELSANGRHMYIKAEHSYNTRLVTISLPNP